MAGEIRAEFCLVVHLIPDDGVGLARGAGGSNGKDETAIPGHQKQLQNLGQQSGETTGCCSVLVFRWWVHPNVPNRPRPFIAIF